MTIPGEKKATITINFGKLAEEEWEIKKIDKIILNWIRPATTFRVFSWYPGASWNLIAVIKKNSKTIF